MINNPIINTTRSIYYYLLFWLCSSVINFLLFYYVLNISLTIAVADSLVYNVLLAGLGLSFWYSARYISIEDDDRAKAVVTHLSAAFISTVIYLVAGYFLVSMFIGSNKYFTLFTSTLAWRFLIGILFYLLINAFYYIIVYYNTLQEKIIKESELKNLVTEAELKSLKFQINPHFIFNSLNSMSALTTLDPDKAREMILKLAEFLRYTLANNEREKNKLSEEIRNLRLYLDIEKIRFEEKFDFVEEMCPGAENIMVPNMILQPIFENAIKHAVYDSLEKVIIKLSCKEENNFLVIHVENNFEKSGTSKKGAGIGLQNIKNRLSLIYNRDNLMEVHKGEDIFKVILYIPV